MGLIIYFKRITIMNDKKNNFAMWLFSKGMSKALNWILVILAGVWIVAHLVRVIF